MKRVIIISLACILALFQYSWGYQAEAEEYSEGLVDVIVDIVTAPCSLLAVCLGMDSGALYTSPKKQRLTCVPVKKPCRPPRTSTTIRKVPSATKPPTAQVAPPGVSDRPPDSPAQTRPPAPPVTTKKEIPPQREAVPGPPTGRPKLPEILPGPGEPMPAPGTPKQPVPVKEQRTPVPQEQTLKKTPNTGPVPPTPGISKTPGTPIEKPLKQEKSRQWAPCVPVYPPAPCMPIRPPAPCGPGLFFR